MPEVEDFGYASQRFRRAVADLACGHGSIQERVSAAFHSLSTLVSRDRTYGAIGGQLVAFIEQSKVSDDGSIDHWARDLSIDEAVELAGWVLEASYQIDFLYREASSGELAAAERPLLDEGPAMTRP